MGWEEGLEEGEGGEGFMIRGSQGFHCLFDLPKCVDCAIISSNVRLFVLNVGSWLSLLSLLNLKTHISSLYCTMQCNTM